MAETLLIDHCLIFKTGVCSTTKDIAVLEHLYENRKKFSDSVRVILLTCLFIFGYAVTSAYGQTVSNEGTEFYAVFPTHVPSNNRLASFSIFITGKQASSGVVSVGSFSQAFTITANSVTEVEIPRDAAYIDESDAGRVLTGRAIKILVDPGKPKVVVYGHIFGASRSAASLILPKGALGQKYFSMNYRYSPNRDGGGNFITIVATEANTKVFLRKNNVDLVKDGIVLNQGDAYEYLTSDDPTGIEIVTDPTTSPCKKIAVFSGSSNSLIGAGDCQGASSDPLFQQNYPIESWGENYGFVPLGTNSKGNFVRILAGTDNTKVRINGTVVATLNAGAYYHTEINTAAMISADKAVAVAQYAASQACSGLDAGDPEMVILNPIEYNIKQITVYSSTRENIRHQFINVVIRTSSVSSFTLNGAPPLVNFSPLPGAPGYSYAQIDLENYGTDNFSLSANEGFNAIAYGFGEFESYAYSAGTNLAANLTLSAVRSKTGEELSNACTRENFDFKLVLPEPASAITWKFEDNPEVLQKDLNPVPIIRNGKTLYEYFYPGAYVFTSAGEKKIKVVVDYPGGNICNVAQETIDFVFNVYDPPKAAFSAASQVCASVPVTFTDESIASMEGVSKWYWEFGDGEVSQEQNPTHTFTAPGVYIVKLRVSNDVSCISDLIQKEIRVIPFSEATFTYSEPNCDNNTVLFTATAKSNQPDIEKWIWDFGDNTPLRELTQNVPVSHTFAKVGSYSVKLTVINGNGCERIFTDVVKVFSPSLTMGPGVTIIEGGQVPLEPLVDGNNLTYKWVPSSGLNRDDIRNPIASPNVNTTYTLTITSEEGCTISDFITVTVVQDLPIPNTFTPNGDGVNDLWEIENLSTNPLVEVHVFNRYGEVLFYSLGYKTPWDGKHKGRDLPVGTYYYIVNHKNLRRVTSGSVTILR